MVMNEDVMDDVNDDVHDDVLNDDYYDDYYDDLNDVKHDEAMVMVVVLYDDLNDLNGLMIDYVFHNVVDIHNDMELNMDSYNIAVNVHYV
eukprot:CAMPEP_0114655924 /NCGR_PEP_ID=MMETSP0191-20121206/11608_1 /TAXON_ID=126664 /ORGANISM="Sorites sp." /LENGTH=89 /DNA_ID=CAMNT_0001872181 /DNA_START=2142 /DNA_END=2411 /DNA_ORIENTATION=+